MSLFVAVWFALVGVWPFAHPSHDGSTVGSVVDLLVHWAGIAAAVAIVMNRHAPRPPRVEPRHRAGAPPAPARENEQVQP